MKPTLFKVEGARPGEGVSMQLGHEGLKKLLRKKGIDVETLKPGQLVMCINGARDKLKVIGCKGIVLGYVRMPKGQRLMDEAIQYLPETFGGTGFSYDDACKKALGAMIGGIPRPRAKGPLEVARAAGASV